LSLRCHGDCTTATFQSTLTIQTRLRPIALQGDTLASCDDVAVTLIQNLKDGTSATLRNAPVSGETAWQVILFLRLQRILMLSRFQLDRCVQVVFAFKSILVIRARSIHLFPEPILNNSAPLYTAIARHSFGWVDGISVCMAPRSNPVDIGDHPSHSAISILLRTESDNPWSQEQHNLQFFTLSPNPHYALALQRDDQSSANIPPYLFPPSLTAEVSSVHGSLRCADIKLQPYGTAVWVHPRNRAVAGLIPDDVNLQGVGIPHTPAASERLVAAVFPGVLSQTGTGDGAKTLWTNEFNDWTCLDYNEELGRIALGSRAGSVTVLEL
jgi:hypothetical protein